MILSVFSILFIYTMSASACSRLELEHTTTSICPGSIASYECSGAETSLTWVAELNRMELWTIEYHDAIPPGPGSRMTAMSPGVVGESVLLSGDSMNRVFASVLNITLSTEDVLTVSCEGSGATRMTLLHVARKFAGTIPLLAIIPTELSSLRSHSTRVRQEEYLASCGI